MYGSNRTFMELKLITSVVFVLVVSSNRTFMELKFKVVKSDGTTAAKF